MKRKDKLNEERRFWAASIILAGIYANFAQSYPARYLAIDAVELADNLLHTLDTTTPPVFNNIKEKDKNNKSL